MEDIKRRVVLDEATREVLVDEVFVRYDPTFSWLGALPEGSRPAGEPRTIEVTLWYEDGPVRADPSLPPMDPFERLPRLRGAAGEKMPAPRDGSQQVAREEPERVRRPVPRPDAMLEATQAWAERLKLGEMQREDPYSRPFVDLLVRDSSDEARMRRMRAVEVGHPECFAHGKRKQSMLVASTRYELCEGGCFTDGCTAERTMRSS